METAPHGVARCMSQMSPDAKVGADAGLGAHLRVIARLDIKGPNLIKGIHLEGLRVVGDPHEHARRYYAEGADELLFIDIVASLYQRNNLTDMIQRIADQIYVPITVGGGIRSLDDVSKMMHSGADKVAINTAAIARPALISEVSRRFGSQCMVLGVEAKRVGENRWEAYTDNGRERTGKDVVEWVRRAVDMGVGEILLTSVDQEGTRKGFDLPLIQHVCNAVNVPVIASGGFAKGQDLVQASARGASAVAVADALHWKRMTLADIKDAAVQAGLDVRTDSRVPDQENA
jgi:cyclase